MKNKTHSINVLFMLVLFTMFAVLSVLLIIIGSNVYKNIVDSHEKNGTARNVLSYVTNKVRTCTDEVFIEEKEGTDVLVIGIDSQETLIFFKDGQIHEATISSGDDYNLNFGDVIESAEGFEFELNQNTNMLKLKVVMDGKAKTIETYIGAYR